MAPSTFASAAAGGNTPTTPRTESSGEWAPRRTNGATQTFRRPSVATSMMSSSAREVTSGAQPAVYVPPHRNGPTHSDTRYSKNQLLDLYHKQNVEGSLDDSLSLLFVSGWEPTQTNGVSLGGWGRRDEQAKDHVPGPEVCWEKDGSTGPLGLVDMNDEEKEHFSSVNSPLKPPTTVTKDAVNPPMRKISVSQNVNSPGAFAVASPGGARPGPRRRETQEAYPFPSSSQLNSPSVVKTARDDSRTTSPPPSLTRRRTDFRDLGDSSDEKPANDASDVARPPFSGPKRTATGPLNTAVGSASSPWSGTPQSAGFSPMGAFGNFAINSNASVGTPTSDKRPGLAGGRAESRFKGLMARDTDDGLRDKQSGLESIPHEEQHEQHPTGSAALGGGQDISPPRSRGFGTPSRQDSRDEFGHAAFGMTSDPFRALMSQQHDQSQARSQQQQGTGNDPMSPSDTNPYQSPDNAPVDLDDGDDDESDMHNAHLPNLGGLMNDSMSSGPGAFHGLGNLGRVPAAPPSDRSQTSSVGPNRGFGGFSGLGALPGLGGAAAWGGPQASMGTPSRDRAAMAANFGDNPFGSADIGSPSLSGLSGLGAFGGHPGQSRGGSRLGSLFPNSVQEQMRPEHGRQDEDDAGSGEFATQARDTSSPFRRTADLTGASFDQDRNVETSQQEPIGQRAAQPATSMQAQAVSSSASNQPPPAQQKTMVMPDRMRWIYRDPQGVTQGPWSGLEMHDWYKAGFFSPELLVKKFEDLEYEPLAQLIRRIGNSREPFLVPQIGIPHGVPAVPQPPANWASNPLSSGGAQPPFANSFPSFGTTLTADQQNALERRKQEEQYLMARQKEHLAQQQFAQRFQAQTGHVLFPQLHPQSSVQSLHSQNSFGSLTSPAPFQSTPLQSTFGSGSASGSSHVPGFFDNSFRSSGSLGGLGAVGAGVDALGNIREEDVSGMVNRLNLGRSSQGNFGGIGQPFPQSEEQQQRISTMLNDRSRLEQQQAQHDAAQRFQPDQPARNEQFEQFQNLQEHARADPFGVGSEGVIGKPIAPPSEQQQAQQEQTQAQSHEQTQSEYEAQYEEEAEAFAQHEEAAAAASIHSKQEPSLTEQVQKAASVKQSPAPAQSPWAKVDTSLPQPFPPAPSQSPLPAPAAQRNRSHVADALHAESRSRSQTPSAETPSASVAPWAKEPAESSRGPSLKEIQEAEAKVAAEAEALAAEARRVAYEKELAQVQLSTAPAPGLPLTSNWASSATASPATGTAPSPWAKAAKTVAAPASAKSMAQIQKEEEARKKRLAAAAAIQAAAAVGTTPVQQSAAGKRYADLASKVAGSPAPASPVPGIGGAWTTVGASGKVKTPLPAPTPVNTRVASATVLPTVAAVKKTVPARATTGPSAVNAIDEFKKWAVNELKHDLNKSVTADEFVSNLLSFPSELEIVTEAVHSVSHTIDSRHFAEEFIRRRKLADKGLIDTTKPASPAAGQSGGWSEVAKKNAASSATKQEPKDDLNNGSFKVVPTKKKGSKK
ncbi:hypothetical protein D6D06_04937 [Aureobasidium pullulans]|nr:hypothetical protein D6D06_04937 [Aureobasidium pullulans]